MSKRKSRLPASDSGLRRTGSATVYLNAWPDTLFMPLLALFSGILLGVILFVLCDYFLGWQHAWQWWPLFALYWLWQTEGWWFGLTCRRFAQIQDGTLRLYGAFGRIRYQGRIARQRFYHFGNGPHGLIIEAPDGRIRRFALSLCRNHDALLHTLSSVHSHDRLRAEGERMRRHLAQTRPAYQYGLLKIYAWILLLPLCMAVIRAVFQPSSNLYPLDTARYISYTIAFLALLPFAVSCRHSFRHFRWLNLPAHHYWRQTRYGNWAAEALYVLRYLLLMAALMVTYSLFTTDYLAWLSLVDTPYAATRAHLEVKNRQTCGGRYRQDTWKISVRMPAHLQQFDGAWCSPINTRHPMPPAGMYTVYVRASTLAQELRFEPPKQ